ncbi:MAG TPA: ComEC/Rec2 family competence protein [Dysgonamonadaceae bacterium]|nr:ComEC/Rec2 family competence protein [Dysgonamonadaceae bacterium]
MNRIGQMPFLKLLIPVVAGILFCRFISSSISLYSVGIIGLIIILFSFLKKEKSSYVHRGVFGVGLMFFFFSFTGQLYKYRTERVSYNFPNEPQSYIGEILDLPQQKERSVACEVELNYPVNKKVLLYFETENRVQQLKPGDQILVKTAINPIKNLGNPDNFDYKRYMEIKGFSGTAYVSSTGWINTEERSRSLKTEALRTRAKILDIYKTFDLNHDEYAFLSAITLGYKADLSNELKEAFRATGTSHVLAVSGLHVGIVYIIILSLFSFLGKRRKRFIVKQILVLLFLWGYVFITGMPVSVIRAAFMLSFFSIGTLFHKKAFTYNTLASVAFFILLVNPLYLFDLGFQLSFASVFSILFFQPKISKLYTPKLKITNYAWALFTVSTAAQLGVFPLALYYFGTFPTYFFATNLFVLPFIGLIIYLAVANTLTSLFIFLNFEFVQLIHEVVTISLHFFVKTVLRIVYFFEKLPMALLSDNHISIVQLLIIFCGIYSFSLYLHRKRAGMLITFLSSVAFFLLTHTVTYLKQPINQFVVYNNFTHPEMGYRIKGKRIALEKFSNRTINHPSVNIVLLIDNVYKLKTTNHRVSVDYLILSTDNSFSIKDLSVFFEPKRVIIDSSISRFAAERIKNECQKFGLFFHDISDSGAYSINF